MAEDDESFLTPGSIFGRYAIVRQIGKGGMGAVYEATHLELRKRVALKTLLPAALLNSSTMRARFLREGETAARVRHPNVVDIFDVGVHESVPFLVMEFLEGEDLATYLEREGPVPLERLADLMLPILDAVAVANDAGVVHRDLKPGNIFLARTRHRAQEPMLLDFGISKVFDGGPEGALTAPNTMMGTTLYMSPEQANDSTDVDARSDQYSLGVILYECATGRHPFAGAGGEGGVYALVYAIVQGRFQPPRALRPDLPESFEQVVLRAMESDRTKRFASVHEMASALLPFASASVRQTWEARPDSGTDAQGVVPTPGPPSDAQVVAEAARADAPTDAQRPPDGARPDVTSAHGRPETPRDWMIGHDATVPERSRARRPLVLAGFALLAGLLLAIAVISPLHGGGDTAREMPSRGRNPIHPLAIVAGPSPHAAAPIPMGFGADATTTNSLVAFADGGADAPGGRAPNESRRAERADSRVASRRQPSRSELDGAVSASAPSSSVPPDSTTGSAQTTMPSATPLPPGGL